MLLHRVRKGDDRGGPQLIDILQLRQVVESFRLSHAQLVIGQARKSTLALATSAAPPGSGLVTVEDTPESLSLLSYTNKRQT